MPPDTPLLAIVVPTYNRADHLARLLDRLASETTAMDDVVVHVSDNASPDHSAVVINDFQARIPGMRVTRHPTNVGSDENFCGLIAEVDARYFWLIGDDDLPHHGAVALVRSLLMNHLPDTVYTPAEWMPETDGSPPSSVGFSPSVQIMSREALARRVHVYTTFISGWIVRTELAHLHDIRRFAGSSLVQLGWVLGALEAGDRHLAIQEPILRATSGNSGGYSALKVFGSSYPAITRSALDSDEGSRSLAEAMIRRSAMAYLPPLIWTLRSGTLGSFADDPAAIASLRPEDAGGRLWFRVLIFIATAPRLPALFVTRLAQVFGRAVAIVDRLLRDRNASRRL